MQSAFSAKKQKILSQLSTPISEYTDLSPKGSIDEPIRELINEINGIPGLVTTSSCSGRISVFLEGQKKPSSTSQAERDDQNPEQPVSEAPPIVDSKTSVGGKGGGGNWLFVSHSPVDLNQEPFLSEGLLKAFNLDPQREGEIQRATAASNHRSSRRYVHLKFEAMILHILTSSPSTAQKVLNAALSAGFRESGALSISGLSPHPAVAVRSSGLGLDTIVGYLDPSPNDSNSTACAIVDASYLEAMIQIANERFQVNRERIARFRTALLSQMNDAVGDETGRGGLESGGKKGGAWEDKDVRRERKRLEGLQKQKEIAAAKQHESIAEASRTDEDDTAGQLSIQGLE